MVDEEIKDRPYKKFAVAIPVGNGRVLPLEFYHKLENLRERHQFWTEATLRVGISSLVSVEFINKSNICRLLKNSL